MMTNRLRLSWLFALIVLTLLCIHWARAQTNMGPIRTPQVNQGLYVGQSGYTTIQSAVNYACRTGARSFSVIIQPGMNPTDTPTTVTGGCFGTFIEDFRTVPFTYYSWTGSVYQPVSTGGGGGGGPIAHTTQVLQGDNAGGAIASGIQMYAGGAFTPFFVSTSGFPNTVPNEPVGGMIFMDYPGSLNEGRLVAVGRTTTNVAALSLSSLSQMVSGLKSWEWLNCSSTGDTNHVCAFKADVAFTGTQTVNGSAICTQATGCGATGGGANFPATPGVVYNTTSSASRNATYSDIVGLWTGCTSGFLMYNGTCSTPSGGGGGSVSITAPDGTLTVTPTPLTGTGTVALNLAHANTWTAPIAINDTADPTQLELTPSGLAPAVTAGATTLAAPATVTTAGTYTLPAAPGSGLMVGTNTSGVVAHTYLPEVDGNCALGVSGAWSTGNCGAVYPSTAGLVYGTSTTTARSATAGDLTNLVGSPLGSIFEGDSISTATGASNMDKGYASILRLQVGGRFNNQSTSGDQCLDTNRNIIGSTAPTNLASPSIFQECGTNDVTNYASNANLQKVFQRIVMGNLLWASVPETSKKRGQACTKTTGFTNPGADDTWQYLLAQASTINGDVLTCTVNTGPNGNVGVGYWIGDGNGGTFTIKINGTTQTDPIGGTTTFSAFGDGGATISTTQHGTPQGFVGANFTGFPANSTVTVVFTVTSASSGSNKVEIGWVNGFPASSTANPYVVVVSPNHQNNANDTLSGTYAGFEQSIVSTLSGYGMNVIYADTRSALGTNYATYYSDALHPNDAGHALMASTIAAAIPTLITNAPANLQNGPTNIFQQRGIQPLNPSMFWSPNPYAMGDGNHTWGNGILLSYQSGNAEWIGADPIHGAYIAASYGGGSLCTGQRPVNFTIYNSTPNQLYCPTGIQGNGVAFMGANSSSQGGFLGYGGNAYVSAFGSYMNTGGFNFHINATDTFLVPTQIASPSPSPVNQPSVPLWFQVSAAVAAVTGNVSVGLQGTATPAVVNPALYISLVTRDNPTNLKFAVDFSAATTVSKIGKFVETGYSTNSDLAGQLTLSSGTATFAFTGTYTVAPICVATDTTGNTTPVQAVVTTTQLTINGNGSDVVNYICVGRN